MTDQSMKRSRLGVEGLWQSFYSQAFYRNVLLNWRGFALRYLLLLSLVFSFMTVLGVYLKTIAWLNSTDVETVFHSLPTLKFKHGGLTTDDGNFVTILHPSNNGAAIIIVDPKDSIKDAAEARAPILLQSKFFTIKIPERKNAIRMQYSRFVRDGSSKTDSEKTESNGFVEVTGTSVLSQLKSLADFSLLPVGVVLTIFCFSFTYAKSMLLALMFKLFRSRHKYVDTTRLLIVACTPNLVLTGVFLLLNIRLGQWDSHLFNGIYILYVIFAFRACTSISENAEHPD